MGKRKYYKKKASTSKQLDSLRKDVKSLKNDAEWKYKDASAQVNCYTTPVITPLNLVAQDTTASTHDVRQGDFITGRKLIVRGIARNDNGTPGDCVVRLMVVKAKDVSNTLPVITQILDNTVVSSYVIAPRKFTELSNFAVLWDQTFAMDNSTHQLIPFKFSHTMRTKSVYELATATIGALETNGYFLITISDVAGTTDSPLILHGTRYYFQDN